MEPMLTRNVLSPEMYPFVDAFSPELYKNWKCNVQLQFVVIIYIIFVNTIVLRKDTGTWVFICHQLSGNYFMKKLFWVFIDFFLSFNRDVEHGDVVTVGECRPLSKTVHFNVLKVTKGTGAKKTFKKF